MNISLIVAMNHRGVIGFQNSIPWKLPRDLSNFRSITWGKPVIMGMKTWRSLKLPLVGRTNIVLSRKCEATVFSHGNSAWFVSDTNEALKVAEQENEVIQKDKNLEVMIIGGGQIYKEFFPRCNKIYLTLVDGEFPADTYFPTTADKILNSKDFNMGLIENWEADEKNTYNATYFVLEYARKGWR